MPDIEFMSDSEMRMAVIDLLQREEERLEREERQKREQAEATAARIVHSIEIIKWCAMTISTVMVTGLVVGVVMLLAVNSKVGAIREEIAEVEKEAERIFLHVRQGIEDVGENLGQEIGTSVGLDQVGERVRAVLGQDRSLPTEQKTPPPKLKELTAGGVGLYSDGEMLPERRSASSQTPAPSNIVEESSRN